VASVATETRIGTRIKRARERKRMSQEELAAAVDASRSAVNSWENDRAYPRNRIGALEDVLGISLDEDAGHARPVSPQLRQQLAEVLDDPEDLRYVIGLLEGTIIRPSGPPAQAPGRTAEDGTPGARQTGG